jgi:hypothetical protein
LAPVIITDAGLNEQLGACMPPLIVPHVSLTLPVYPLTGVSVMVDLDAFPAVVEPGFNTLAPSV